MTKADLLTLIMDCPTGDKKTIEAYVAKVFSAKVAEKQLAKPAPTVYQLFCYEQRPIITERLVDEGEYDNDNKALFGAITKELSKAWAEAKHNPQYAKATNWYNKVLACKMAGAPVPSQDTDDDDKDEDKDKDLVQDKDKDPVGDIEEEDDDEITPVAKDNKKNKGNKNTKKGKKDVQPKPAPKPKPEPLSDIDNDSDDSITFSKRVVDDDSDY